MRSPQREHEPPTTPRDALALALALAEGIFGPESDQDNDPSAAPLGKAWARLATGRGTVLEVRIGWIACRIPPIR